MTHSTSCKFGFSNHGGSSSSECSADSSNCKQNSHRHETHSPANLVIKQKQYSAMNQQIIKRKRQITQAYTKTNRRSKVATALQYPNQESPSLELYLRRVSPSNKPTEHSVNKTILQSLRKPVSYSHHFCQLDNCPPGQIKSISKSFHKLQKLRHRQNTCTSY